MKIETTIKNTSLSKSDKNHRQVFLSEFMTLTAKNKPGNSVMKEFSEGNKEKFNNAWVKLGKVLTLSMPNAK